MNIVTSKELTQGHCILFHLCFEIKNKEFFLCATFIYNSRFTRSSFFFVNSTLFLVLLGHITHPWPWGTPSRIQNYNPYHQTMTFFLSLSFLLISVWNWFLKKSIMDGPTDQPTNWQTNQQKNGRTY